MHGTNAKSVWPYMEIPGLLPADNADNTNDLKMGGRSPFRSTLLFAFLPLPVLIADLPVSRLLAEHILLLLAIEMMIIRASLSHYKPSLAASPTLVSAANGCKKFCLCHTKGPATPTPIQCRGMQMVSLVW